jgi:hypothetical protein
MTNRGSVGALVVAAVLALTVVARAHDEMRYPDWGGQWLRIGGVQWDPSKPPGRRQQPPFIAEYQRIFEANLDDVNAGGDGNNPTYRCIPPGLPRNMTLVEPMEIIITASTTYLVMEYMREIRRIYTDGRGWPATIAPSFSGYSIGHWGDAGPDGRYDTLVVETRGLKGPRTLDSSGMPLHADNQTIVTERLSLDRANTDVLHDEITTVDHAFTRPWAVTKNYRRSRNPIWFEFVCDEGNHQIVIGKENYAVSGDGYLMPTKKDQPAPDFKYFDQAR